jgi:hypothetical protein
MGIQIKEVTSTRDLKRFVAFPFRLYEGNRFWVPPLRFDEMNTLRKDKNPAFEFCKASYWMAYRDVKPVGRIAGILNTRYNELWGKRHVRFGWADFVDDEEVSAALFGTVEEWGRSLGMNRIHGPLGFTDMDREGMLVEGFNELGTLATIYNHPYYPSHVGRLGYRKDADWVEYHMVPPQTVPEKIERLAGAVAERYGLKTLKVQKARDILPYAREIFDVINTTYTSLYGFVPLTEKQIDWYVKQYFGFIRPEYVPIVLDQNGRVAAFGITMPSVSKALQRSSGRLFPLGFLRLLWAIRHNKAVDLYLTAVRPEYQEKGVNAILMYEMNILYARQRIRSVESNPELESNKKVQAQWRLYGGRQHKRRRCYIKDLSDNQPAGEVVIEQGKEFR